MEKSILWIAVGALAFFYAKEKGWIDAKKECSCKQKDPKGLTVTFKKTMGLLPEVEVDELSQ